MKKLLPLFLLFQTLPVRAQHNPGTDCLSCHPLWSAGGTVYADSSGSLTAAGVKVQLLQADGVTLTLDPTNSAGNIAAQLVPSGSYLVGLGPVKSRTWHTLPGQGSCNTCHVPGGNGSGSRTKKFPPLHTTIPPDNGCTHCHHFPATMAPDELKTPGVLHPAAIPPAVQGSRVELAGGVYWFDPADTVITTVRPDIFAAGYFSMFDVILAVAGRNGIGIEYEYDAERKTHFITTINGVPGAYWYHFSYDAGSGNATEIGKRRANRWDELLWRPGVWVRVVEGEDLAAIKAEYLEEIQRETQIGHVIPSVRFSINPSVYQGNPPESDRRTVSRTFSDVAVTAHNLRAAGSPTSVSKPFQPGVVTSIDIPLSLADQRLLDTAFAVFYTRFAGHHIDSYYMVGLGFPGVGLAHASGRQGFVYVTENGSFGQLPNQADNQFHVTCDIAVLHAPDFSVWRWIELGNPYYEAANPTSVNLQLEDYGSIGRGFNLHPPWPNPFNGEVRIAYNVFEAGYVTLEVVNILGQSVGLLVDRHEQDLGVHEVRWKPGSLPSGRYIVVMRFDRHVQVRTVSYVK